jgi:elongation factor P--beta-lysine ligase
MSKDKEIDLERMEIDYRASILTNREIGAKHGCSHTMVGKYAVKFGWERDLTTRIQARVNELVSKQVVSKEVSKEKLATEKQVIEENAHALVEVKRSHIQGIGKLQKVCDDLMDELVTQSISREELQQIAELAVLQQTQDGERPDAKDVQKRLDSFLKLLGLSDRADTFKKLVDAKTRLVTLERSIFEFDKGAGKAQSLGEFLESLS